VKKKAKQRSLSVVDADIQKVETERDNLFKQKVPIDLALTKSYNKLERLQKERDELMLSSSKIPDWEFLLSTKGESMARYYAAQKALADIGLGSDGEFLATKQRGIKVSLNYQDTKQVEATLSGLKTIVPFLKPINNVIAISIFEHTLSEFGVYHLILASKGQKCKITKITYGREEELSKFNTWKEALTYISKRLWYEGYPGDDDED